MIGCLLFLNSRGDIVLSRAFRDGYNIRQLADTFRLEVIATKRTEKCPVVVLNKVCYMHLRHDNMYLVACTALNVDAVVVFQFMVRLLQIFHSYFGSVHEDALRDNFVTVQQIIDEAMDFGYPQLTEVDLLKAFITTGGTRADVVRRKDESEQITIKATGKIPWRRDGINYDSNEAYVDVVEDVNLLMSQQGKVLQREVIGRVVMRSFLSGMPECSLVVNDKMMVQQAATLQQAGDDPHGKAKRVTLDDVTFHSCVQLGKFDAERSICFTPPDGEFVLMRYRSSENVNAPFRVLSQRIKEIGKTRLEVDFHLKTEFPLKAVATDVVVKVPCPHNTASVKVRVTHGKAKYDATEKAVLWKLKRVEGAVEIPFSCEVSLIQATLQSTDRVWARPPICLQFSLAGMPVSGLEIQSLRINEPKLGYKADKYVRYKSSAGQYQIRL